MSFSDPNINNNKQENEGASYNFVNRKKEEGMGLVQLLLVIVTVFVILLSLGLFGYSFYLNVGIVQKTEILKNSGKVLDKINLPEIKSLSHRLKMANELISRHQYVGSLFNVLEKSIEGRVVYNSFNLSFDDTKNKYNLSLQGEGANYEAVIKQIDIFKSKTYENYFSNVEVRSIVNKPNSIDFSLNMDTSLIGEDKMKDNPLLNSNNFSINTNFGTSSNQFATSTQDILNISNQNTVDVNTVPTVPIIPKKSNLKVESINSGRINN